MSDDSDYENPSLSEDESINDGSNISVESPESQQLEDQSDNESIASSVDFEEDESEVEPNIAEAVKGKEVAETEEIPSQLLSTTQEQLLPPSSELTDDEDDDEDENQLKKFDQEVKEEFLVNFHPESVSHNYDEIYTLAKVTRDVNNTIIDDFHRTIPILSKYEKTRVLGQRAKQINTGSKPFVTTSSEMIDGLLIANEELRQKKIPFIIRRPLPSGASEYWHLQDLELL